MDSTADSTHAVNGANGLQINGSVGEISTPQEHIVRFAKPDLSEPNNCKYQVVMNFNCSVKFFHTPKMLSRYVVYLEILYLDLEHIFLLSWD